MIVSFSQSVLGVGNGIQLTAMMGVMLLVVENMQVGRIASMVKKYALVVNLMAVFIVRTVAMWLVVVGTDNMS